MKLEPQAFCEAFWRGKTRHFALALSEGFIHFWEPDSKEFQAAPDEWRWVVEGEIDEENDAIINTRLLKVTLGASLKHNAVGRMLWMNDNDTNAIFVRADGAGQVYSPHRAVIALFRAEVTDELFSLPASAWNKRIQAWRSDEDSNLCFALKWRNKERSAKGRELIVLSRGEWEEMNHIAQLVMTVEYNPLPLGIEGEMVLRISHAKGKFSWKLECSDGDGLYNLNSPLEQMYETWFLWFHPTLNYDLMERHKCAKESSGIPFTVSFIHRCVESSQHELLETRLQLRDWLRDRVGLSDERIAQLLN